MTLGSNIREVRTAKQLTLKDVADKTNLTSSYLSQIERNITEPSISALRKVANALNVPLVTFLTECDQVNHVLTKADQRVKLDLPNSNVIYEFLTPIASHKKVKPKMEAILIDVKPNSWSSDSPFIHEADELIIVSEGQLQVVLENHTYVMSKGDSLYLKSNAAHRFYNNTDTTAKAICVISSPI